MPDLLPARMLNEFAYCPRLFCLEWVQGEFADSVDTVEGRFVGRRTAHEQGPAAEEGGDAPFHAAPSRFQARPSASRRESTSSRAKEGAPLRSNTRRGPRPIRPRVPGSPNASSCASRPSCSATMAYECDEGIIYFAASKKRVPIAISQELVDRTLELAAQARALAASGYLGWW